MLWQIPAKKTGNNVYEPKLVPSQSQERESCKYLLHSFAPYPLLYLCQMDLLQIDLTIKTLGLDLLDQRLYFNSHYHYSFYLKTSLYFHFFIFLMPYVFFSSKILQYFIDF